MKNKYKYVVLGTGLSSLGAILALKEKGEKILIVDTNEKFYSNKEEIIFCDQDLPLVKILDWQKVNVNNILRLKAFGGHSNIWGGSCLRLFENEFYDWPIKYSEIEKYYDKCEKILNLSKLNINSKTLFFNKNLDKNIYIDKAKISKYSMKKKKIFSSSKIIHKFLN